MHNHKHEEACNAVGDFQLDLAARRRECFRQAAREADLIARFGDEAVAMKYANDVADGRRQDDFELTTAAEAMLGQLAERSRPGHRPEWVNQLPAY
ncbi:MAG: hypothetical protein ACPGXK_06905 [Phycisphaerae bacterium]